MAGPDDLWRFSLYYVKREISGYTYVLVKGAASIGDNSRVVAKVCFGMETDVRKESRCVAVGVIV